MANITDHQPGKAWQAPPAPDLRKARFCITELSSSSLVLAVFGVSGSLWMAIAAVVW